MKTPLFCDEECEKSYSAHFEFRPRSHVAKTNAPSAKAHIEFERIKNNFFKGCGIARQLLRVKYNITALWDGERLVQV